MKFNGAIVSKPLKDELEKVLVPLEEKIEETQKKSLQRGSAEIAFTDIINYEPSQIPEAVFEVMLENRHLMFRIAEKTTFGAEVKYTLSTSTFTNPQTAYIYIITVKATTGVIEAYKYSITSSGVTLTTISNIPSTIKVYFDFM